jgi:hypothetical protein
MRRLSRPRGAPRFRLHDTDSATLTQTGGGLGLRHLARRGARGSQLQFDYHGAHDHTRVTVGSLDKPQFITPERHIWVNDRLPWAGYEDGLAEFSSED